MVDPSNKKRPRPETARSIAESARSIASSTRVWLGIVAVAVALNYIGDIKDNGESQGGGPIISESDFPATFCSCTVKTTINESSGEAIVNTEREDCDSHYECNEPMRENCKILIVSNEIEKLAPDEPYSHSKTDPGKPFEIVIPNKNMTKAIQCEASEMWNPVY